MSKNQLHNNLSYSHQLQSDPVTVDKPHSTTEGEDSPLVFAPSEFFSSTSIPFEIKQPTSQAKPEAAAEEAKENVLLETSESLNKISSEKTNEMDNSLSEHSGQDEAFSLKSSFDQNTRRRHPLQIKFPTTIPKNSISEVDESPLDRFLQQGMNPLAGKPRIKNDYIIGESLGKGSFGEVFRCTNKLDGKEYAVKFMQREFFGRHMLYSLSEAKAMAIIANIADNVNIVRYYNSWEDNNAFFIAMEYCPSSLMEERKERGVLAEGKLKEVFKDVCLGLQFLHQNNVVHLDIKPENILISKLGKYKLGDMGQAQRVGDPPFPIGEGDSRYLAEEVLNDKNCDLTKVDIFSLGMTFFELVTEIVIPKNGELWRQLRNENFHHLDQATHISEEFKSLIKLMMSKDPSKRPSTSELLERLSPQDPEMKWEKVEKKLLEDEKESLQRRVVSKERRRKSIY